MKIPIVGLMLAIAGGVGYGQPVLPSDFIDKNWASLQSFHAKLIITKTLGQEPKENFAVNFDWREDVDDSFITHQTISRFSQTSFNAEESFDGSQYALIDKSRGAALCKVSKFLPADVKSFELGICPLEPFRFLTKAAFQEVNVHPTPRNLRDCLKIGIPSLASIKDAIFLDKPASSFETPADQENHYEVFLDKTSHQLLGWQCFSSNNHLNTELAINKWSSFKTGKGSLMYSSDFTIRYFKDSQNAQLSTAVFEYSCSLKITGISITPDPSAYMIDPANADYIWDLDKKVLIRIPR